MSGGPWCAMGAHGICVTHSLSLSHTHKFVPFRRSICCRGRDDESPAICWWLRPSEGCGSCEPHVQCACVPLVSQFSSEVFLALPVHFRTRPLFVCNDFGSRRRERASEAVTIAVVVCSFIFVWLCAMIAPATVWIQRETKMCICFKSYC